VTSDKAFPSGGESAIFPMLMGFSEASYPNKGVIWASIEGRESFFNVL
jgi:hypothetical protein